MTSSHTATDLRSVALPAEHGGWSLTLEPAALGLIVAPSIAGAALAGAALLGFVARTPFRVVMVDRYRSRSLPRTVLAQRVLAVESATILGLIGLAVATTEAPWWPPLIPAAALVSIALWYDVRSKGRRVIPELTGTVGVAAIAASIVLAGGGDALVAYGLWLVMAARAASAVMFVRLQLRRAKHQPHRAWTSDIAQAIAGMAVLAGVAVNTVPGPGAAAVVALGIVHVVLSRRPPPTAAMLGAQQVVFGLTLVIITALGAAAPR